jgi:hypothetical protein
MICTECTKGNHCGKPVKAADRPPGGCACQHRHPGAWKGVKAPEAGE